MFCFRCKLMFEKKRKDQAQKAHMATKAHKLTLYIPTRITQDRYLSCNWNSHGKLQRIAYLPCLAAKHKIIAH